MISPRALSVILVAILVSCSSTPVVKPPALAESAWAQAPEAPVRETGTGEQYVAPGRDWFPELSAGDQLVFAGLRETGGKLVFHLVLECSPAADRLIALPVSPAGPLDVLASPERTAAARAELAAFSEGRPSPHARTFSLDRLVSEGRIGPPLPTPPNIYAVAANYPSHLSTDLAIEMDGARETLGAGRARVFRKYPPVPSPGRATPSDMRGYIGPFDTMRYPARITLPEEEEPVETRVDYEVEIGVVLARDLTAADLDALDATTVWSVIAGAVLMSDTKARNPQAYLKIQRSGEDPEEVAMLYASPDADLDPALGLWDETTETWWSHAASFGDYAAAGPFFVATHGASPLPRDMLTARTYAPASSRPLEGPPGRIPERFYLRQASTTTEDAGHPDGLVWPLRAILTSILTPGGALDVETLKAGDILCLGTPGGTVITSKSQGTVGFLIGVLFWWSPLDFHDVFFEDDAGLYLEEGDEVFFWANGMGYQRHRLEQVEDW